MQIYAFLSLALCLVALSLASSDVALDNVGQQLQKLERQIQERIVRLNKQYQPERSARRKAAFERAKRSVLTRFERIKAQYFAKINAAEKVPSNNSTVQQKIDKKIQDLERQIQAKLLTIKKQYQPERGGRRKEVYERVKRDLMSRFQRMKANIYAEERGGSSNQNNADKKLEDLGQQIKAELVQLAEKYQPNASAANNAEYQRAKKNLLARFQKTKAKYQPKVTGEAQALVDNTQVQKNVEARLQQLGEQIKAKIGELKQKYQPQLSTAGNAAYQRAKKNLLARFNQIKAKYQAKLTGKAQGLIDNTQAPENVEKELQQLGQQIKAKIEQLKQTYQPHVSAARKKAYQRVKQQLLSRFERVKAKYQKKFGGLKRLKFL